MKKVYVKPVMESEAFVANEYVAACHRIKCEYGEEGYAKDPSFDAWDRDGDGFGQAVLMGNTLFNYYTGSINGKEPEEKPIFHYHIIVEDEPVSESDPHPNASV